MRFSTSYIRTERSSNLELFHQGRGGKRKRALIHHQLGGGVRALSHHQCAGKKKI